MMTLMEPNPHPIFVHFTYALFTLSALSLFVVSFAPAHGWRDRLQHAGDWMMAFGVLFTIGTAAAGFYAYYTVAHDAPSHAAMTTHRNWAIAAVALLLAVAAWRYFTRAKKPGLLFTLLFLAAAGVLTTTAWWGGRLVYHHGLGVKSMPKAEEPGHAHEHAPGEEHDKAPAAEHQQAGLAPADAPNHDAEDTAGAADLSTPIRVAEAFAAALKSGDAASVERLLMPDVVIAEGGGAERSFAEYFGHHMPADMAFMKDIDVAVKQRDVIVGADMATVVTASQMHGSFQGRTIHHRSMETLVLKKAAGNWRIAHIHWSSAPITGEHEH